jgi:hypothetical protein
MVDDQNPFYHFTPSSVKNSTTKAKSPIQAAAFLRFDQKVQCQVSDYDAGFLDDPERLFSGSL